ncbi:hypothetical protein [Fluviicola sp.]|uniref:hypothetical protein n=1 Tax=Fluviicola sp. TaxID=1917219 RepID=UPI003D2D52FA
MKKTTLNKRSMFGSVHTVLTANQAIWNGVPAFVSAVSLFENNLTVLDTKFSEQSTAMTGVTKEKQELLNRLSEEMILVHNALYLLGKETNSIILQERNRISKSDLVRMTNGKAKVHGNDLKNDLQVYGSELEVYGITAVFISQLIAKIDTLPELIESSRIALLRRKGATRVIEELESKLTEILRDQIDRMMLIFKTDHPAFVLDYQNARTRVGNGSRERDDGSISAA